MAMTWRERIQAARERGGFTREDRLAWGSTRTCLVGEAVAGILGGDWNLWESDPDFQGPIFLALSANDFDAMDHLLDAIEDRALALKREAQP